MRRVAAILYAILLLGVRPATAQIINAPTVNGSVTITAGNTFQQILAVLAGSSVRRALTIQNNNASDNCWLFIGAGSATEGTSILLQPGQPYTRYYPYVPSDEMQATCATSSDTMYVDTQ